MGTIFDKIDTCLLTVGGIYSLANLEEVLGIVILVIQLSWIVTKLVLKILKTRQGKTDVANNDNQVDVEHIDKEVDAFVENLIEIKDIMTNGDDEKNE